MVVTLFVVLTSYVLKSLLIHLTFSSQIIGPEYGSLKYHLIFDCPFAIQVWHMTGIWIDIQHVVLTSAGAIFLLLKTLSSEHSQRLAATLWILWKHNNLKAWDDVTELCVTIIERARSMVED